MFACLRLCRSALLFASISLLLAGCAGGSSSRSIYSSSSGAHYKVGNPYQINGIWYYPEEDYTYDETGIASWYGADFHSKATANGEIYNKNELTAAHKTLPMPSLARVTNLDNGRSIVVRINDRGPYVAGRIIDLSERAASLLGYRNRGVAKVRVQVLADESRAIAEAMRTYGGKSTEARYISDSATALGASPVAPVQRVSLTSSTPTIQSVRPEPTFVQMPLTKETNIYVQAGSFSSKDNALRLQGKLSRVGTVRVSEAVVQGSLFYRVRVGPIPTVEHADVILADVLRSGADAARIVVDD